MLISVYRSRRDNKMIWNKTQEYKAKIKFKMLPTHPDYESIPINKRDGFLEVEESYMIDPLWFDGVDHIYNFIESDLRLIAGGGYNDYCIYCVSFDITAHDNEN